MQGGKPFEIPVIESYRREELLVETAIAAIQRSETDSDRGLKTGFRRASGSGNLLGLFTDR